MLYDLNDLLLSTAHLMSIDCLVRTKCRCNGPLCDRCYIAIKSLPSPSILCTIQLPFHQPVFHASLCHLNPDKQRHHARNSRSNHQRRTSIVERLPPPLQVPQLNFSTLVARILLQVLGQDRHPLVHGHHDSQRPRRSRDVQRRRCTQIRQLGACNGGCEGSRGRFRTREPVRETSEDDVGDCLDAIEGREDEFGLVQEVGCLVAGVLSWDVRELEHGHDKGRLGC